jgi:hypothetical protein
MPQCRPARRLSRDNGLVYVALPGNAMPEKSLLLEVRERHSNGIVRFGLAEMCDHLCRACLTQRVERVHHLSLTPTELPMCVLARHSHLADLAHNS